MAMSWTQPEFTTHHFNVVNEDYGTSAYTMSISPVAIPVPASANVGLKQHDAGYHNDYTPRFQPDPFNQPFTHQQYNFETYPCGTSPSTTGGSGSSYMSTSTLSLQTPPQEAAYLDGLSSHYQIQSSHQICPPPVNPAEQYVTRTISIEDHGKTTARHRSIESSPSIDDSDKTTAKSSKDGMYCPHPDCMNEDGIAQRRFSRKADVSRHYSSQHNPQHIDCPRPRCVRKGKQGFTRKDHLVEHLRGFHLEIIAKREAGAKVQTNDAYEEHTQRQNAVRDVYCDDLSDPASLKVEQQFPIQDQLFSMDDLANEKTLDDKQASALSRMHAKKGRMAVRRQMRQGQIHLHPKVEDVAHSFPSHKGIPTRQARNKPRTVAIPQEELQYPVKIEIQSDFDGGHDFCSQIYTPDTSTFSGQYSPVATYTS